MIPDWMVVDWPAIQQLLSRAFTVGDERQLVVSGSAALLGLALCLVGGRALAPVLFGLGFLMTGPPAAELCSQVSSLSALSPPVSFALGGVVGGFLALLLHRALSFAASAAIGVLAVLLCLAVLGVELEGALFTWPALGAGLIALLLRRWVAAVGTAFCGGWIASAALFEGLLGRNGVVSYLEQPGQTFREHLASPLHLSIWLLLGTLGAALQVHSANRDWRADREGDGADLPGTE